MRLTPPQRDPAPMSPRKKTFLVWLLLVGLFLGIWQLLEPSRSPTPSARRGAAAPRELAPATAPAGAIVPLVLAAVVIGAIAFRLAGGSRPPAAVLALRAAETLVLDEKWEQAEAELRVILARTPLHGVEARVLLGRCAEGRGDFVQAAEAYAWAKRPPPLWRAVASARRAFVLAAADRLEDAEAELASSAQEHVAFAVMTAGLVVRARALVLAKQHRYREVLDLIAEERAVVRETLGLADRELVRMLEAYALWTLTPAAHRVSAMRRAPDAGEAKWVFAVFPRARSLEGAA